MTLSSYLRASADVLAAASTADLDPAMDRAIALVSTALRSRTPVLVCGNGGSMADSLHIAGELVARFKMERGGLPVIALGANVATMTAWSNDYDFLSAYAREVEAFGVPGGVLIALSTSGNSPNIIAAARKARELGLHVIAMTGEGGGKLKDLADVLLAAPSRDTPHVQQTHIALYHYLCEQVEGACA